MRTRLAARRCAVRGLVTSLVLALLALPLAGACSRPEPAAPPSDRGPATAARGASAPRLTPLTIGTSGQELFIYLPLTLARQLGYFQQAGLDVEIANFQGGGKALEALVGGGVDLVVGFYDHTIQAQPKGIALRMVVVYDRFPGVVMLADTAAAGPIRTFADLRGQTIGVSSFGSSTHFLLNYVLARAGIPQDDVGIVQIGTGSASMAALESGKVVLGMFVDPAATRLVSAGRARVLWDTRSEADTLAAFGGPYPAGGIYTTEAFLTAQPAAVQAAVTASVRTLRWLQQHSAADIAAQMPPEFYAGDLQLYVDALTASLPLYSPDGRMPPSGPDSILNVLQLSDPTVKDAPPINLAATYTNHFVETALSAAN
jgi:NitT/TauT family transport system substrate-binding protein